MVVDRFSDEIVKNPKLNQYTGKDMREAHRIFTDHFKVPAREKQELAGLNRAGVTKKSRGAV